MKNFNKLLITSVVVFMFNSGCETRNAKTFTTDYEINGCKLYIYEMDSCEYIGNVIGGNSDKLAHRGRCKFCLQRNKK